MAIGIFRKIGDFAKKIFSKGKEVIGRLLPVAANVASMIPHPAAQMIGTGLNIANSTLAPLFNDSATNTSPFANNTTTTEPPRNVSGMIEFNKI